MYFGCNLIKLYLMIVIIIFYSDSDFITQFSIREKYGEGDHELIVLWMFCEYC